MNLLPISGETAPRDERDQNRIADVLVRILPLEDEDANHES